MNQSNDRAMYEDRAELYDRIYHWKDYPDDRLRQAADSFFRNLRPGRCALVEPWLQPHVGIPGHFSQQTYDGDDMKLCRCAVHEVEGRLSNFDFHWLVTTSAGCEHFVENHQLWMYTRDEFVDPFEAAGFQVDWRDDGLMARRGLLIAHKG